MCTKSRYQICLSQLVIFTYLFNSSPPLICDCLCTEKRKRSGSYALGDNAAEHNRKRVFWPDLGGQNRGKGLLSLLTDFSNLMYWL